MAFKKTIQLPNGISGEYIRIGAYRWDRLTREASAELMLYSTQVFADQPGSQAICLIGKLRLANAKFDQYLSNTVLDAASGNVLAQLYAAAKAETIISGGGLPAPGLNLAAVTFSDAADI